MGQGASCNCVSKLQKGEDGYHRNGEVVVSQPTLLTSEPAIQNKQSMPSMPSTSAPALKCPTGPSSPAARDHTARCPVEPTMTPPDRGQSSPGYKYNMRQLLQMAEEERRREQMQSPQSLEVSQHAAPREPVVHTQLQQQQSHQVATPQQIAPGLQHGASHPAPNQRPQNQLTEPMASPPQPAYQTSARTRFQQIPHTVPLAAGVDRLDPVVVQQLVRSGQCILVDVRGDDRSAGTIEGAIHVPAVDAVPFACRIQEYVRQWREQPLIIFHCQYSAHRAPQCANWYREQAPDYQRVAIMDGGFRGWESTGLHVQQGKQGLGGQQHANVYAMQQGMQLALSAQQSARVR